MLLCKRWRVLVTALLKGQFCMPAETLIPVHLMLQQAEKPCLPQAVYRLQATLLGGSMVQNPA